MDWLHPTLAQLLTWQALLDIAIIASGLFYLYRTLLRLGTWKILLGIGLAFLLYTFSSLLNLTGVNWIFNNISHVAVLAMIVIFQPELRKLFEKLVSIYSRTSQSANAAPPSMLAETLWRMGRLRCGALVVIPGRENIEDKITGGYPLDGSVSTALIQSIFDHHSPGHDGAVILADGKITRFGVRLPISETGRLTDDYGTRHHAAMGMAEACDALVFAVSEERGVVTLFSGGEMQEMPSPEHIVSAIAQHNQHLGSFGLERESGFSRRTIVQAASCLVLAMVFWSTLNMVTQQRVERLITVPVEYTAPKNGLVLVGDKVNEIKVHLSGTKADLDNLAQSQPSVTIALEEMNAGERTVLISEDNLRLPRNINLVDAVPDNLEITLAEIVQKTVPIIPQLIGSVPEGLTVKNITIEPDSVQVLAPPDRNGNKTVNVSTTPVYLRFIETTSTLYCKIIAPPSMQAVSGKWPDVQVLIELEQASAR